MIHSNDNGNFESFWCLFTLNGVNWMALKFFDKDGKENGGIEMKKKKSKNHWMECMSVCTVKWSNNLIKMYCQPYLKRANFFFFSSKQFIYTYIYVCLLNITPSLSLSSAFQLIKTRRTYDRTKRPREIYTHRVIERRKKKRTTCCKEGTKLNICLCVWGILI